MIEQIKREAADTIEALKQKHEADLHALLRRFYGPHSEPAPAGRDSSISQQI